MSQLSGYVTRRFLVETLALAGVVVPLLYLIQCFRLLDVISVRGQDIGTLLGQSLLGMPQIVAAFAYVCLGIGLARMLVAMQANGELLTIHASRRLSGLFGAIALVAAIATVVVFLLTHVVSPLSQRVNDEWQASIAADLVSRALTPHRFAEVVPGVTVAIGGRHGEGNITDFFADDRRDPESRRTYIASSAIVVQDEAGGYVLQMSDGAVQYQTSAGRLSEIAFERYDLAVDLLTQQPEMTAVPPTLELVQWAMTVGDWREGIVFYVLERSADPLRIVGIVLLVVAIAGYPSGRRRQRVPLEVVIIAIGFLERGIASYMPPSVDLSRSLSGAVLMIVAGIAILVWRASKYRIAGLAAGRRQPA